MQAGDIILLCETWEMNPYVPHEFSDFNCKVKCIPATKDLLIKKSRNKGGLVGLISKEHKFHVVFESSDLLFLFFENSKLVLGVVCQSAWGF